MKKILFALILLTNVGLAQPAAIQKIASQIDSETLRKNLFYLASDKMEGRLMASHGDTLASLFVADWFKKNKLTAPYGNNKSYFQAITSYKLTTKATLTFNGHTYPKLDNWLPMKDFTSVKNATILVPFFSDPDDLFTGLATIDCKGKILLLTSSLDNKFRSEEEYNRFSTKLAEKGVVAVINASARMQVYIDNQKKHSFLPQYTDSLSAFAKPSTSGQTLALTEQKMNEILSTDHITLKEIEESIRQKARTGFLEIQTKISAEVKKSVQETHAPNVIGVIKGSDKAAECIIVSAHHDHDGRNGKEIYYGAVDNASGTVAIMEMAAMMNKAVQTGSRPKRTIVFASYTGEERGLLGSYYFVDHPIFPINKTRAVLNIDMMGRVDTLYSGRKADSTYAYFLVKDSLNVGLRNSLYKANEVIKLKLDGRYENPLYAQRRIRGSDQYPFYKKGVPFVRIDCGFAIDYHKPTDTPDKINYPLLTKQVQLAFLTLWNMAND